MMQSIWKTITTFFLGKMVHHYAESKLADGGLQIQNRFEIRCRNEEMRLHHARMTNDGHDVHKSFHEYELGMVEALGEVLADAVQKVKERADHDYGMVFAEEDGSMTSQEFYYVAASGSEFYLFCRIESKARLNSSSRLTYLPLAEIQASAEILQDAAERMRRGREY